MGHVLRSLVGAGVADGRLRGLLRPVRTPAGSHFCRSQSEQTADCSSGAKGGLRFGPGCSEFITFFGEHLRTFSTNSTEHTAMKEALCRRNRQDRHRVHHGSRRASTRADADAAGGDWRLKRALATLFRWPRCGGASLYRSAHSLSANLGADEPRSAVETLRAAMRRQATCQGRGRFHVWAPLNERPSSCTGLPEANGAVRSEACCRPVSGPSAVSDDLVPGQSILRRRTWRS